MADKYPAVFMRGGSSKGLFFKANDLPPGSAERDAILLGALGSPDPYERQLNGMGGGLSSLSKIAIIAPSQRSDADVDYTFGQVAVNKPVVDYKANCGNLSSAVGPLAVDEGMVSLTDGESRVRMYNTNTQKIINSYFRVKDGRFDPEGDFVIAGVAGSGSRIRLAFTDPGGALTSRLLPTSKPVDRLHLTDGLELEASLVDASNPIVFVAAESLGLNGCEHPDKIEVDPQLMARLDEIRRLAGVMMGLAQTPQAVPLSNPKVAMVAAPRDFTMLDGNTMCKEDYQLSVRMLSMERVHRAITSTGAMCCAAAVNIPGTIPAHFFKGGDEIAVGNPSGALPVGAKMAADGETVMSLEIYRTARRLMDGFVYV